MLDRCLHDGALQGLLPKGRAALLLHDRLQGNRQCFRPAFFVFAHFRPLNALFFCSPGAKSRAFFVYRPRFGVVELRKSFKESWASHGSGDPLHERYIYTRFRDVDAVKSFV